MAVLLTGGTGKNSTRISHSLLEAKIPFVITSRKGQAGAPEGVQAVKFDWLDASTYENPFQHEFPGGVKINAVFLVQPEVFDPETSMNAFIDYAVEKHSVKRFVLLTGSMMEQGGPQMGKVWQHLIDAGVEWCVLRCTWFMGE